MKDSEKNPPPKKLLNISRFSRKFEISRPTVYKMIRLSLLTPQMIGKRQFIDCSDDTIIIKAIKELPLLTHHGTSSYYEPKSKDPFNLAFEAFEKKQEAIRQKRKLARLKKVEL